MFLRLYKFKKYSQDVKIKLNFFENSNYINNLTIEGPLGILQKNFIKNLIWVNWNLQPNFGFSFNILWNSLIGVAHLQSSFILKKTTINVFIKDIEKLIIGVLYGWFISFNIYGRGFSFRLIKRYNKSFLKLKIGYSHFVYYQLSNMFWVKVSKKKNKLFIFCLDFWQLQKLANQIRALRSKHTYKIQGILYTNEVIKVKPGKQKQV